MTSSASDIVRLVAVYDADGSWRGELSYVLRKRIGRASCALCDITHGRVRERSDWRACKEQLTLPIVTYHRDDQPGALRAAFGGVALPFVAGEQSDGGYVLLVDAAGLQQCAGSPGRLVEAVQAALDGRHRVA